MQKIVLLWVLFVTLASSSFALSAVRIGRNLPNRVLAYTGSCEVDIGVYSTNVYIADWRRGIHHSILEKSVSFLPPSWSPDGKKIAYTAEVNGQYEIYIRDLTTGIEKNLTKDLPSHHIAPSWSPDGQSIAFYSNDRIAVANIKTGKLQFYPVQISNNVPPYTWSSDGSLLALYGFYPNTQGDIFILNTLTEEIEKLSTEQFGMASEPAWSPDGRYLTFTGTRFPTNAVYLVDLETAAISPLTKHDAPIYIASTWSPDGEKIAMITENAGVHLFNLEGELIQKLSHLGINGIVADDGNVSWSPDGKYLALYVSVNGQWKNYLYSLSSGSIHNASPETCYYSPVDWRPEPVS